MLPELFYCDTHQTLQDTPSCEVCIDQDGTGANGEYAKTAGQPWYEREEVWRKLAQENHKRLLKKYGSKP